MHPAQQTPRPSTPPTLSYSGSMVGSEYSHSNSHSNSHSYEQSRPSFAQGEEHLHELRDPSRIVSTSSTQSHSNNNAHINAHTNVNVNSHPHPPSLRISTTRNTSSSRLPPTIRSPSQSTIRTPSSLDLYSPTLTSPISPTNDITMAPTNTTRSSIDRATSAFRVRSHSSIALDQPRDRNEEIRAARRAFEEKEAAKEEKAARKEARAAEKSGRKSSVSVSDLAGGAYGRRDGSGRNGRASSNATAKTGRAGRSRSDLSRMEKLDVDDGDFVVMGNEYDDAAQMERLPVSAEEEDGVESAAAEREREREREREKPRRSMTKEGRKKTQSAWAVFMMWLRTRFLRMSKSGRH